MSAEYQKAIERLIEFLKISLQRVREQGEILINAREGYRVCRATGRYNDSRNFRIAPAGNKNFCVQQNATEEETIKFLLKLWGEK